MAFFVDSAELIPQDRRLIKELLDFHASVLALILSFLEVHNPSLLYNCFVKYLFCSICGDFGKSLAVGVIVPLLDVTYFCHNLKGLVHLFDFSVRFYCYV